MNRKMIDLALALKCGFLGASGSVLFCWIRFAMTGSDSMDMRATFPRPKPTFLKSVRRVSC